MAIVVAVISFIFGEEVRRNNEVFSAWTTITTAHQQSGSGGRIKALQFLNSRPWRFPWILFTETWTGQTEPGWYWDKQKKKCKLKRLIGRRWEREPLTGLSAPGAYLRGIHLCGAVLQGANLQEAVLQGANLQEAVLQGANLQEVVLWGAENLTPKQIKSACFWSEAIYKGEWNEEKETWEPLEPDNTNFIEELKQDKTSDPEKTVDCSKWEK